MAAAGIKSSNGLGGGFAVELTNDPCGGLELTNGLSGGFETVVGLCAGSAVESRAAPNKCKHIMLDTGWNAQAAIIWQFGFDLSFLDIAKYLKVLIVEQVDS